MDDGASEERTGTRTIIATLGKGGDGVPSSVTATFLFCDLVGSTALLTRIGDDANDDVRRQCFGVFREAVAQYRGIEVKRLGTGCWRSFGTA